MYGDKYSTTTSLTFVSLVIFHFLSFLLQLQKAYFQQSEEIKSLKEQIKLKDKRIRQLEDELSILRTPSDCGPGQSDC
jgi:cell division protein FtsL